MDNNASKQLHDESVVIDAVCPLVMNDQSYVDWYRRGGASTISPTVGGWENAMPTLVRIGVWHRLLRERDDLVLVRDAAGVRLAKRENRMGIYLHLQGADPIEDNLDLIDLYKALGVGVIQLTYNVRNRVGDGCEEQTDDGLSQFGRKLVKRLNCARVIVDCSHTGIKTSLEAIEQSRYPVILSHSNVAALHQSARNVPDVLIRAISQSGGVIGVAGFPAMVANSPTPSLDEFIEHIDAIVERAGIDHVGLGVDYYWGQSGVASDAEANESYQQAVAAGRWSSAYPPPPHHYPKGIETPKDMHRLTARLLERGYDAQDVKKILGENWLRVMKTVWG